MKKKSVPNYEVHWGGKLLPDTTIRNKTNKRLTIVLTNKNIEQIMSVNSTT